MFGFKVNLTKSRWHLNFVEASNILLLNAVVYYESVKLTINAISSYYLSLMQFLSAV